MFDFKMKKPEIQLILLIILVITLTLTLSQRRTILAVLSELPDIAQTSSYPLALLDSQDPNASGEEESSYAPDQVIVKFKPQVAAKVEDAKLGGSFGAVLPTASSLDELGRKYKVFKMERVFRSLERRDVRGRLTRVVTTKELAQQSGIKFPARKRRVEKVEPPPALENIFLLTIDSEQDVKEVVRAYQEDSDNVDWAQVNFVIEAQWIPNDPYYSSSNSWGQGYDDLWGLKKLQTEQAWNLTQGQGVVVGVIDTGLDYTHPDIVTNVWVNSGEDLNHNGRVDGTNTCPTPNGDFNCADDDANGYVDDIQGWDFSNADNNPADGHGHGTHVAGTIAAVGNNGLGVIGVAPQVKIMAVKGFDDGGGAWISDLANALVYAAVTGADVLNNSWGCQIPCPSNPVIEDAVRTAYGFGAAIVFAAGNSNDNVMFYSPQNMTDSKPVVVAASDHQDQRSSFSNYGGSIDVAAPGGESGSPCDPMGKSILSLRAANTDMYLGSCGGALNGRMIVSTNYYRARGTSMAAPHAAGVAALILSRHPTFTNEEVRQVLRASSDDIGAPRFDIYTGAGRLNAAAVTVDSLLSVEIAGPPSGSDLAMSPDPVPVIGTVSGSGFQQYQLFYGQGATPTTRFPLGSPQLNPVENGVLGTWPIRELGTDEYLLELAATTITGLAFQDFVTVFKENDVRRLTTPPAGAYFPAISGNRIVWGDDRNGNYDIYLYDLATNRERSITTEFRRQLYPDISGNWIVWFDDRHNGSGDIYLYDLSRGTEQRITASPADQKGAEISGESIVWRDNRNSPTYDIYLYDALPEPNRPPLLDTVGPKTVQEGEDLIFILSATDPDDDLLTYSASGLPSGAQFEDQTFRWTPGFNQAGAYEVTVTVSDDWLTDSEVVTITVSDVPPVLLNLADSPDPFTPNGDEVDDTTTISARFNHTASWTLDLHSSTGTLIRTFTGMGATISQIWDGRNASGLFLLGGTYVYTLTGTDTGASTASGSGTVTLQRSKFKLLTPTLFLD